MNKSLTPDGKARMTSYIGESHWQRRTGASRRAAATVELAILLPLLVFLFAIAVDFARIFYFSQTIQNCARNGAIYASNLVTAQSPYASLQAAALADASNLDPQPTVTSTTGTDAAGNSYVQVTVTWQFQGLTSVPGVPTTLDLSRTVQMRVAPP
jgi:Flp pilus assembly protein TadG